MHKILLFSALYLQISLGLFAQEFKAKPDPSLKLGGATKSQPFTIECAGEINTPSADLKWKPVLTNKCIGLKPMNPDKELIESIKAEKWILKQNSLNNKTNAAEQSVQSITPAVGKSWLGNTNNGTAPMDNGIAVSDAGIVVSVANTTVEIDDPNGNLLYYNDLATFFADPLIKNTCDPVVVYDKLADRFILFFQECAGKSTNSYLCIAFSKTNNPATGGWWKYKVTGNPLNNNCWFDYPKMAISNNELYITGNLFYNSGGFNQAVLYQIQKTNAYSGGNMSWQFWSDIDGSPFTLLPLGHGHGQSYGPGCFLVATKAGGASSIKLYDLTDYMTGNPKLEYYSVSTPEYTPGGDVSQSGTACLLDNGDCRALSGFYLNGIIHFVFHSDIGNGWNGINYNRLTVSTAKNQSSTFGFKGSFDYCYPSVASFSTSPADKSVMIGFGRSSASIFPEMRVVNCDNDMNWSASTLVKQGINFVSYTSSSKERWGDYTGMTRKHNSTTPAVWMNGMYGRSDKKWDTWIAEIKSGTSTGIKETTENRSFSVFPNPVSESFTIEFSLLDDSELSIGLTDITGKTVKELYSGKAFRGENFFSFDKSNLPAGTYFLSIRNQKNLIRHEKIIIAD